MSQRPRFWDSIPLAELNREEWEALCDGCGKCCLNKLEDEETGEIAYTRVACRLFDGATCRCSNYPDRKQYVPECVVLDMASLAEAVHWLPRSCAYKTLFEGRKLPRWHPLRSGDPETVHRRSGIRGRTVSEEDVPLEDWEDHIIHEAL